MLESQVITNSQEQNINLNDAADQYFFMCNEENLEAVIKAGNRFIRYFVRLYGKGHEFDDLMQVGTEGLMKALKRYSRDVGTSFSTYAGNLIMGEIRHYIRKEASFYKPRIIEELQIRVDLMINDELSENGEIPSIESISKKVNVKETGISEIMRSGLVPIDDIDISRIESVRLESFKLPIEDRILLEQALNKLNTLQKNVINMLFYKDLTQEQTAKHLGINQRKVSRVLHSSLEEIRKTLS